MPLDPRRLGELLDFGAGAGERKEVLAVVLFGSAARGEVTATSDVDVAVIYSKKSEEAMREIEHLAPPRTHLVHASVGELGKNLALAGALSGEGLLLFGKPVRFEAKRAGLRAMSVLVYDTTGLAPGVRSRLQRALYGGVSTVVVGEKRYRREYPGLIARPGIQKLGKAVLLVARERVPLVTGTLERHGAKWKEFPVWTY